METIIFDLSCFKEDFQKYILKKLNCENYYEFLNIYKNDFSIKFTKVSEYQEKKDSLNYQLNEEDSSNCEYKNFDFKTNESSEITTNNNLEEEPLNNDTNNQDDSPKELNFENTSKESDEDIVDDNLNFTHYIEKEQIFVNSNKKFIPKKLSKNFKKNGGEWLKSKNIWIFPLSAKNFIENYLSSLNTESLIQSISQEKSRVIIHPKINHPNYGTPIIYDKTGNVGIWDISIKGWIFQKNKNTI